MHLTGVDLFLWTAGFAAHSILLLVLLVRRRASIVPAFTALVVAGIARTVTLYSVWLLFNKHVYFYTFWTMGLVDTFIQLAILYQIAVRTFRPLDDWASDLRGALLVLLIGSAMVAAGLTSIASPSARLPVQGLVIMGNFFSSVWMSELFVGMVVLSVRAGLPWKTHVARIAQGHGAYSVVDVGIDAAHGYLGANSRVPTYAFLSHLRMVAYLACVVYWIIMLWRNAPESQAIPENLRILLQRLQTSIDLELEQLRRGRKW